MRKEGWAEGEAMLRPMGNSGHSKGRSAVNTGSLESSEWAKMSRPLFCLPYGSVIGYRLPGRVWHLLVDLCSCCAPEDTHSSRNTKSFLEGDMGWVS
jgi:hypothetical protein